MKCPTLRAVRRTIPSIWTIALPSTCLIPVCLGGLTGRAAAMSSAHLNPGYDIQEVLGTCVPGEAGFGSIEITYSDLPPGRTTVTNTLAGPTREAVTSAIDVTSAPLFLSDLDPGWYVLQSQGQTPQSITVPVCLADGDAAPITAAI
jgi:hypothetical protein